MGRVAQGSRGQEVHLQPVEAGLGQELWVKAAVEKCQEALGTVPLAAAE